jgi:sensor c-di-GMP phosphodiesterase-like protein
MLGGAVAATLIAMWIGELTVRRQQHIDTGELAESYIVRSDKINAEAITALAEVAGAGAAGPQCSAAEISRLRRIVLSSQYLKTAAQVQDGHFYCSSTAGIIDPPEPVPEADFVADNGSRITFDTPEFGIPGARARVIAKGNASVSLNSHVYSEMVDSRIDYAVIAVQGAQRRLFMASGVDVPIDTVPLRGEESTEVDGRLFAVRCSSTYDTCIVAALRDPPSILTSPVMLEFGIFGLLIGLSGGIAVSSMLGRSNSLGRQLRTALRSGKLRIVYQPIVRLSDRRRTGAEALLRWTDATGKSVSPDAFISVAEQDGFIGEITRFVINRVLAELGDDLRRRPDFQVTVNVAASDILDNGFLPFLQGRLLEAGLAAASIGLEVTERTTANSREMGRGIARLREAGHKVYIDDFGTDYSSLSYLSRLRVDAIKINRTFMQALHDQSDKDTIAPQIVAMAEVLGLSMVIEGIEEEQQAAYFLTLAPKAMGQGWLFSKPVEAARLFGV